MMQSVDSTRRFRTGLTEGGMFSAGCAALLRYIDSSRLFTFATVYYSTSKSSRLFSTGGTACIGAAAPADRRCCCCCCRSSRISFEIFPSTKSVQMRCSAFRSLYQFDLSSCIQSASFFPWDSLSRSFLIRLLSLSVPGSFFLESSLALFASSLFCEVCQPCTKLLSIGAGCSALPIGNCIKCSTNALLPKIWKIIEPNLPLRAK